MQDGETVRCRIDGPKGSNDVKAAHLIGADGAHSTVREQAGIAFPGDELDRLVPDVIELERLACDIADVLKRIDPGVCPNPRIATQILELLYPAQDAGATIDMAAGRRVSTLIATLAEEQSVKTAADRCRRCTAVVSV